MLTLFFIVYDAQAKRGKKPPSSLALLLFEIIWNAEYQNNWSDKPEQKKPTIKFTQIVKAFCPHPKIETS